jgi:hypothetical protein
VLLPEFSLPNLHARYCYVLLSQSPGTGTAGSAFPNSLQAELLSDRVSEDTVAAGVEDEVEWAAPIKRCAYDNAVLDLDRDGGGVTKNGVRTGNWLGEFARTDTRRGCVGCNRNVFLIAITAFRGGRNAKWKANVVHVYPSEQRTLF